MYGYKLLLKKDNNTNTICVDPIIDSLVLYEMGKQGPANYSGCNRLF